MSVSTRKALVPSLVAILVVTPEVILGQAVSTRPASIALTVVVPRQAPDNPPTNQTSVDATVVQRTNAALDVETVIGVGNQPVSRIEVRLGVGWSADPTRVLVQNRAGEFERLAVNARVAVAVVPASSADHRSRLRFRLESDMQIPAAIAVPLEYRVTVGDGDQIAVWTFPALLEIGDDKR